MSLAPLFCNVSALTAEMATGTSDKSWARPCAVTTIGVLSLSSLAWAWGAVVWARAGVDATAIARDTPNALLRRRRAAKREDDSIFGHSSDRFIIFVARAS
jgi:hypothetical protein